MLDTREKEELRKGFRIVMVIWIAMLVSVTAYAAIAHIMVAYEMARDSQGVPLGTLKNILYVIALATLLLTPVVRKAVLKFQGGAYGKSGMWSSEHVGAAMGKYMSALIVALALAESIAIYGLVLFLLGDNLTTLYTFVIVSAVAMLFYRPKMEELENLALEVKGNI